MPAFAKLLSAIAAIVFVFVSMAAGAALKSHDLAAVHPARAAPDNVAHLEGRETLQQHCKKAGVSCVFVENPAILPEASGIGGSQGVDDGTLYLINASGGQGTVECGKSVAHWSIQGGRGLKKFDGTNSGGNVNNRLTGEFSSSDLKKTLHGVITSHVVGEDLNIYCGNGV